jgi:acyl-CoA thioester hydrolase
MGIVHHSNYIFYYEVARTELMRSLGSSYKELEDRGVLLVIRDVQMHFISPAYYDEILTVRVSIDKEPQVKAIFDFEIFNEKGELIHTATVTLASVDKTTRRPVRCPAWFVDLLTEGSKTIDTPIPVQSLLFLLFFGTV